MVKRNNGGRCSSNVVMLWLEMRQNGDTIE
jgi:hypothetical protein